MTHENILAFCGGPPDRAGNMRTDPAWLEARRASGLVLPFWRGRPLVTGSHVHFLPWQPQWEDRPHVFLRLEGKTALFALTLPADAPLTFPDAAFEEIRAAAAHLAPRDCALVAHAHALLGWHGSHGFCAQCGALTTLEDGGYRRHCPACGANHFPRTDPAVIMLPILKGVNGQDDQCLVGHNVRFSPGYYSAFAGFVEPGETVEQAVMRELTEEASLDIGAITYHASQPWPFPSLLMIGFYAEALSNAFTADGDEITDARWMGRAEVRARLGGEITDGIRLPAPIAIAHRLIRHWAEN
jgi:NAD+ diphosphatase